MRETKRFKTVLYVCEYRYTVSWTDVNGKLVYTCNGSPWFPSIFPAKHYLAAWHAAAFTYPMAAEEKVASALNKLADRTFLDILSPRDKSSIADLTADFLQRIHKRTRTARKKRSLVIELH